MITYLTKRTMVAACVAALASLSVAAGMKAAEAEDSTNHSSRARGSAGSATAEADSGGNAVTITSIEPTAWGAPKPAKDRAWLGVAVEEGSEALGAQLGLPPGAGLVVTWVAPDSPAAKAGLEKNDVLVELDAQLLVVPAQLRKLVEVRKQGDSIDLTFYRAGKKQTASATLAKAPASIGMLDNLPWSPAMKSYRDLFGQEQTRRGLEQAEKAVQEAIRAAKNAGVGSAFDILRNLQHGDVDLDNHASVTVRRTGEGARSIVKADESGTIVIVCNPKPHLTAHDKEGKLLFDGEIATPEERAKVPPELMEKVEPLLDKMNQKGPNGSRFKSPSARRPAARADAM